MEQFIEGIAQTFVHFLKWQQEQLLPKPSTSWNFKILKYLVQYNFFSVPTLKCLNSLLYWQSIYYSSHNHSIHQSSPKMHYIYVPTSSVKSWIAQRIRTPSGLPYMLFFLFTQIYLSFTLPIYVSVKTISTTRETEISTILFVHWDLWT